MRSLDKASHSAKGLYVLPPMFQEWRWLGAHGLVPALRKGEGGSFGVVADHSDELMEHTKALQKLSRECLLLADSVEKVGPGFHGRKVCA